MGITELCNNKNIVIKKADKGSAVVVMNATDYLREGYRQLGDTNVYTKLKNDPTDSVSDKITRTLIEMKNKGYITEENLDHLKPTNAQQGNFTYYLKFIKRTFQVDLSVVL